MLLCVGKRKAGGEGDGRKKITRRKTERYLIVFLEPTQEKFTVANPPKDPPTWRRPSPTQGYNASRRWRYLI
jgi:hypothetical protein